jgi:hypothetical protein
VIVFLMRDLTHQALVVLFYRLGRQFQGQCALREKFVSFRCIDGKQHVVTTSPLLGKILHLSQNPSMQYSPDMFWQSQFEQKSRVRSCAFGGTQLDTNLVK